MYQFIEKKKQLGSSMELNLLAKEVEGCLEELILDDRKKVNDENVNRLYDQIESVYSNSRYQREKYE